MFLVVRHLGVCYNAIAGRYHKNRTIKGKQKKLDIIMMYLPRSKQIRTRTEG